MRPTSRIVFVISIIRLADIVVFIHYNHVQTGCITLASLDIQFECKSLTFTYAMVDMLERLI